MLLFSFPPHGARSERSRRQVRKSASRSPGVVVPRKGSGMIRASRREPKSSRFSPPGRCALAHIHVPKLALPSVIRRLPDIVFRAHCLDRSLPPFEIPITSSWLNRLLLMTCSFLSRTPGVSRVTSRGSGHLLISNGVTLCCRILPHLAMRQTRQANPYTFIRDFPER